jgi:NmrA-like family
LTAAFKGIDVVVSTAGNDALENQLVLMDATSTAGFKRFISPDYGFCMTNPKLEAVPIYAPISKIRQSVRKWRMGKLTWTVRACGAFLDFLFGGPRCWILPSTKRDLYDEGDNRISSPSMPNNGKAMWGS